MLASLQLEKHNSCCFACCCCYKWSNRTGYKEFSFACFQFTFCTLINHNHLCVIGWKNVELHTAPSPKRSHILVFTACTTLLKVLFYKLNNFRAKNKKSGKEKSDQVYVLKNREMVYSILTIYTSCTSFFSLLQNVVELPTIAQSWAKKHKEKKNYLKCWS